MPRGETWIPLLSLAAVLLQLVWNHGRLELPTGTTLPDLMAPSTPVPRVVPGGAFVHVGKTGGSTLTRRLRNACHSYYPKPCGGTPPPHETLLSRLVTDYYHVPDFFRLPRQRHEFYLISLRDPFQRTVSGFVFGHPDNAQVLGEGYEMWKRKRRGYFTAACFETLEIFVQHIGDDSSHFDYPHRSTEMQQKNCTDFCRAMIHGRIKRMIHLFYGYVRLHSLLPDALDRLDLYVTRHVHLWSDFYHINRLLGGNDGDDHHTDDPSARVRDFSNLTLPVTRELSPRGRNRLCRALEEEYRIYIQFLLHAKNLSRQDVKESLLFSQTQCPELKLLDLENWKERLEKLPTAV